MKFLKTNPVIDNWNDRTRYEFKQDLKDNKISIPDEQVDKLLDLFEIKYETRLIAICETKGTILSRLSLPFLWVFIGFVVCPLNFIINGSYQLDKRSVWLKLWNKVD